MIQVRSILEVGDNSGARKASMIGVIGKRTLVASVGDIIKVNIKEASKGGVVKKGDVVFAVVVCTCDPIEREDGSYIRFDNNVIVIIDKDGNPRGTRVLVPIAREIREKFPKIGSLAPELL